MLEIVAEPLGEGTLLAETYRLERVLGEGGMGVVWAARDEKSGRDVAVKVLADDRATDPTQQARILREASAAMTIDHPNVVKVTAVLETEAGVPFIVMERLEGESLRARLVREGTLELDACLDVFRGVVDAVAAAHDAGIVHRDLKPENVFLPSRGGVKVLDFGIAKRLARETVQSLTADASLTETGAVMGTPYYMAPEQVFGDEDIDARADVWSLGVILYECLAGRRPTEADGFGPILKRITSASFDPLPARIPAGLASITMRMLSRERSARPALAEVRASLDEPARARTAETLAPRRRSALAIGAVVLAASVVAVGMRSRVHAKADAASSSTAGSPPRDAQTVLLSASDHQAKREGTKCLADLDEYDRMPNQPVAKSTDVNSGYAGVRGTCLMLAGRCEEGKKLYRAWLPLHSPPMDETLYDAAADSIVQQFCLVP